MTTEELAAWLKLIGLQMPFYARARIKRAFGFTASTTALQVPWSQGRIASLIVPSAPIWVGGDQGITVAATGSSSAFPLQTNAILGFGPEEGDSPTWIITNSTGIDVRCLELLV